MYQYVWDPSTLVISHYHMNDENEMRKIGGYVLHSVVLARGRWHENVRRPVIEVVHHDEKAEDLTVNCFDHSVNYDVFLYLESLH